MTLFDRRLLGLLDDSVGTGRRTMHDRLTDYQRDLADIERELCKYQLLLRCHKVEFKPRRRDDWIAKHRSQVSIKERFRAVSQAIENSGNATAHSKKVGDKKGLEDACGDGFHTGGNSSTLCVHGSLWVQVERILGLPREHDAQGNGLYSVHVDWLDHPTGGAETPPLRGSAMPEALGREECVVKKQLRLVGASGRFVLVVIRRHSDVAADFSQVVGSFQFDVYDSSNYVVKAHEVLDSRSRFMDCTLKMRLQAPGGLQSAGPSAPSAVCEVRSPTSNVPALHMGRLDADPPSPKSTVVATQRSTASAVGTPKPAMAVVQDPAALPNSSVGLGLSSTTRVADGYGSEHPEGSSEEYDEDEEEEEEELLEEEEEEEEEDAEDSVRVQRP
eukprot:TRINITY_DN4483_c0_g1_i1.p1 TRINITY_DN4483_c0_g1~~TRINITY_DN4483_c0_g1_i1.p1  ORF type:complete len:388 (-),score=82.90 TRINITY_DN4483_c0_g1_i1:79-1242(-)